MWYLVISSWNYSARQIRSKLWKTCRNHQKQKSPILRISSLERDFKCLHISSSRISAKSSFCEKGILKYICECLFLCIILTVCFMASPLGAFDLVWSGCFAVFQTLLQSLSASSCNIWWISMKCNLLNSIVRRARFILCGYQVRRHDDQDAILASEHSRFYMCRYAIAMAMRDNQKVVYTSPLKALSNQKFRS